MSSMNAFFGKQLGEGEIRKVFDELVSRKIVSVSASDSISYDLPAIENGNATCAMPTC
jgi:hypothetical protein